MQMIKKWFKSKIYKEVQVFLNFVNFYRRFIFCYFAIAAFFTNLLKNSKKNKKSDFYY